MKTIHVFRPSLVILFLFTIFNQLEGAEEFTIPPLLAIVDLRTAGDDSSIAEAKAFSEFTRREIEQTGLYRVLSRSSMMAILKKHAFPLPCHELTCFVSMGKLLGADQVLAGHLQRNGDTYELTLRLISVKNASFIHSVYRTIENVSVDDLMGDRGLEIIAEVFQIDPQKFKEPDTAPTIKLDVPEKKEGIPDEVKNKYPGMIYIPAGKVIVGSDEGDPCEKPPHTVYVEAFYIGKYEVTNHEYELFIRSDERGVPPHWDGDVIPTGLKDHPVTWVSFADAEAYCNWLGARLPTEVEWERAAHGDEMRVFPWGDKFDSNNANTWEAGRGSTAPVGSYYLGASPFGVEDMAGNVMEWVSGFYEPYPGARALLEDYGKHLRVLRGGSWNFYSYYARTTHRFARPGGEKARSYGFRVVRDAAPGASY